jgi:iron complex transport system substrate-binding protein
MVQTPDVIISKTSRGFGYEVDDPSEAMVQRDKILNRPEFANVNAVREGRVYSMISSSFDMEPGYLIGAAYMAKWLYPELFEDLNPEDIHQEYLTRFHHLEYDLDEHGVFVYPPIEINGDLAGIPNRYKGQI